MADGVIVAGDTLPVLQAHIVDGTGTTVNLSGATASCIVKTPDGTSRPAPATIVDATNGIVEHDWTSFETGRAGTVFVSFVIMRSGAKQTYPAAKPIEITVLASR